MNEQQMQFFYEIFDPSMPRLGPGDERATLKALGQVRSATSRDKAVSHRSPLKALDLGCGNGGQTIQLARHTDWTILAVDNHQPYLDELLRRAEVAGVSGRIQTCLKDMASLDLGEASIDVIWSEGALYCMGFQEGLTACHRLLAAKGCLAVTELCWLTPQPAPECRDFFTAGYPPMTDIPANLAAMRACGFTILDHFVLPESAWWEPYYRPLEPRLAGLREKYSGDSMRIEVIESVQKEIDIYRKYRGAYGYLFAVMQR